MQGLRCEVPPRPRWNCNVFASASTKGAPIPRHCAVPVHAFYPVATQVPVTHARFRFVSSKIDRDRAANCGNPGRGCGGERAGSHSALPFPRVLIGRFGPVVLSSRRPVRWIAGGPGQRRTPSQPRSVACDQLGWRDPPCPLNSFRKKRLAGIRVLPPAGQYCVGRESMPTRAEFKAHGSSEATPAARRRL